MGIREDALRAIERQEREAEARRRSQVEGDRLGAYNTLVKLITHKLGGEYLDAERIEVVLRHYQHSAYQPLGENGWGVMATSKDAGVLCLAAKCATCGQFARLAATFYQAERGEGLVTVGSLAEMGQRLRVTPYWLARHSVEKNVACDGSGVRVVL